MPPDDGLTRRDADVSSEQHSAAATTGNHAAIRAPQSAPTEPPLGRGHKFALLSAIACTVLGAKLIIIATIGPTMPVFDQWDGEAENVYVPYLNGTYSFGQLFAPHNEHRIVFTRLLTLLHLELAGEWNTRLEMILCAFIHTGLITWLAGLLMPIVGPRHRLLFACFISVLFGLPLGYENTVLGFNFHFYLTMLFGLAALAALVSAPSFSWRWFAGVGAATLSYLSFSSSGVAAILASIILVGLQLATRVRDRSGREFAGIAVATLVAIAMLLWEVSVTSSTPAPSKVTPVTFILGFIFLAGPTVIGVIGIQGPAIWLCRHTVINRPAVNDRAWLAVGIAGWVAIQLAIVAYGRGTVIGVRYIDILLPVYPIALIAVLMLADKDSPSRLKRYAKPGAVVWVFVVVALVMISGYYMAILQAIDWNRSAQQQAVNARAYMITHNSEDLKVSGKRYLVDVAFPDLVKYARILDNPDVRAIMPPEIRPAGADNAGARNRMLLKGSLAKATASSVHFVLAVGPALLSIGVSLFFAVPAYRVVFNRRE